jgi:hypothetical protein
MMRVLRGVRGSEFITGFLMLVVLAGMWTLAWTVFDASVTVVVILCWVSAALLPFVVRTVSLFLLHQDRTVFHR